MKSLNQYLITGRLALMIFVVLAANTANAQSEGKSALRGIMQYNAIALTPSFTAKIIETDSMKFQVVFSNPEKERVMVGAYSEDGNCLYSNCLSNIQHNMYLNFTNVEDGIYYIKISNGNQVVSRKFRISTDIVKKKQVL